MSAFLDRLVMERLPAGWRRIRKGALVVLLLTALAVALFAYIAYGLPYRDIGPEQPIPFSHRLHAGVKEINCRFCHPYVERGPRAGIPEVGKCLFCHNFIIPQHPEIRKLHAYYDAGVPVPWRRVFYSYDHVQFRHQPHLLAGFDCKECHGPVETMDRLPEVVFLMGFCIKCHRQNDANQQCWLACHN